MKLKQGALKYKMKKLKNKIYRKYQDFYSAKDLRDPDTMPAVNLTIADFNAQGFIENPRAPCVATTIDTDYIKDARAQHLTKKFRMKTDILQLREITRNKFMIYATQEMHLQKQRDAQFQEYVYRRITGFNEFAAQSLKKMEFQAFNELQEVQVQLRKLRDINFNDELNAVIAEHQVLLVEVRELYSRFLYLLKLIGYFDEIVIDDIKDGSSINRTRLIKPPEIIELEISDKTSGKVEIERIKEYMDKIVRPYLAQRNHLNADIWFKGYEQTRNKIFNYNRRYTNLALLNHIMGIIYEKFQKTYERSIIKPIYLRDPNFMSERVKALKESAYNTVKEIENKYRQDKVYLTLSAFVPVILETLEEKSKKPEKLKASNKTKKSTKRNQVKPESAGLKEVEDTNLLMKIEKIQACVLNLINKFDALPPDMVKEAERNVRIRMRLELEMSKRALTKQNRMRNWREHMKRHELERAKDVN